MLQTARQESGGRQRAGVDRQQVEIQAGAVGTGNLVVSCVERPTGSLMEPRAGIPCQRVERDGTRLDRVVASHPSGQHAGIDLAPVRGHQAHVPPDEGAFSQIGKHPEMGVPATEQHEPLHAATSRS